MTVAYVTMGFPLDVETFACTDVRSLRQQGVDVSVFAFRRPPRQAREVLRARGLDGLPVDYPSMRGMLRALALACREPRCTAACLAWLVRTTLTTPWFLVMSVICLPRALDITSRLRQSRPDVVHLFWGHYPSLVGWLVARLLPDAVRSVFLGAYDLTYRFGPSRRVACDADVVWTHARSNLADLRRLGVAPHRVAVAHRGVDLSLFAEPLPRDPRRVVCSARLCREKHVDDVIEVVARTVSAQPDLSLVICGDGAERAALERQAAETLPAGAATFVGLIPHADVCRTLRSATFFVFMSREPTERLTNAVKEAMAAGCLCIVARTPGIDELIRSGHNGFLVDPGDVAAAARDLRWACEHEDATTRMRCAAAETIRCGFDVQGVMRTYRRRWQKLYAQRQRMRRPPDASAPIRSAAAAGRTRA